MILSDVNQAKENKRQKINKNKENKDGKTKVEMKGLWYITEYIHNPCCPVSQNQHFSCSPMEGVDS